MNIKGMHGFLRLVFPVVLCFLSCGVTLAQVRIVSGTIKDAKGSVLPGVSVIVKGTTSGVSTDSKGKYSIKLDSSDTLVFSFIGYESREVATGNQDTLDIILKETALELGGVVVTALGITRDKKALPSSVTTIPGVNLTQARENNLGASIQGRVAGVNVSKPSSGPGGSTRVIIRGNKSLNGNNQPLYVVDGIPIDNTNFGQSGEWGGADKGDGLSSINPEDIESVTVLKGVNAAALYGSRGGFGVVNITTKKGHAGKGIGIEFSSNYTIEKVINYLDLQTQYGQGGLANSDPADPDSPMVGSKPLDQNDAFSLAPGLGYDKIAWGAKMDSSMNIMWDGITRPYSLIGTNHNYNAFFNTGNSWTNTIAITGGSDKQTFRFSFSDLRSTGIIPETGFNRKNLTLGTNGNFGKKVSFDAKVMYSNEEGRNRPMVSDSPGNAAQAVMLMPPNYDINDMRGDPAKLGAVPEGVTTVDGKKVGEELQNSGNYWNQNPWWAACQYIHTNITDRVITSGRVRYDITSFIYVQGRVGMDYYTRKYKELTPQGTGYMLGGEAIEQTGQVREINQEWTLGFEKAFGKINVNAFVGGNKMTSKNETVADYGSDFNVPFFASVSNGKFQSIDYRYNAYGINSLFGSVEVSYGGYLFLTGTARNDWFSVLKPEYNSELYPSVGLSFVFTDAFKNLPKILSLGKLRASWGQVATANVEPFVTNLAYVIDGEGHRNISLGHYATYVTLPNPKLSPALSTEFELGTELRLFKGRAGVDVAYYNQKTTNDILLADISATSGFGLAYLNIGKLSNDGIEILLTGKPVQGAFTWDISLNLSKNKNKVISISPGVNEIILEKPRTQTVFIKHIVGQPFGVITGLVQKRDPAGNRIYTKDGAVVNSENYEILGNGVADLTGGFENSFTYKQFNLSFLIDFKAGGDIYSGTNVRLLESGLTKESLKGRDGTMQITGVFENGINPEDGSTIYTGVETRTLTEEQAHYYWQSVGEGDEAHFIYDASFLKLRQLTFGYNFPPKILAKTPIKTLNISIVGRNLACLFRNTPNIDPEASYSNSSSQGLDYFGLPPTRTYGFNLKATF